MKLTPAYLTSGANVETSIEDWVATGSLGGLTISIDGGSYSVSTNMTAVTDMDEVATAITTGLVNAGATTATCVYEDSSLIIYSGSTTRTSSVDYPTAPTSGIDISGSSSSGSGYTPAYLTGGASAESTAATWITVTDGEFAISINGVDYDVQNININGQYISQTTTDAFIGILSNQKIVQTFIAGSGFDTVKTITIKLKKTGLPTGSITLSLYEAGVDNLPTGSALGSDSYDVATATTSSAYVDFDISATGVVPGNKYCLLIEEAYTFVDGSNNILICTNNSDVYANGNLLFWSGVTWSDFSTKDAVFKVDAFSVSDMDGVASRLQTYIRAETGSTETVTWDTDHFIISSVDTTITSAITVTSTVSGGSGTDISGAGASDWMDCDGGAVTTRRGEYMDIDSGSGTKTALTASLGMDFEDILKAYSRRIYGSASTKDLARIDDDDGLGSYNEFIETLNKGYFFVLDKMDEIAPNWSITTGGVFDITADSDNLEQTFPLEEIPTGATSKVAENCETILRVTYLPEDSEYDDDRVKIRETQFDETIKDSGLRWYRQGSNIVFRGVTDDIGDVRVDFRPTRTYLLLDTDRPNFPINNYDGVLVDYLEGMFHAKRKMEIDGNAILGDELRPYLHSFYGTLEKMIEAVTPTDEIFVPKIKYETG